MKIKNCKVGMKVEVVKIIIDNNYYKIGDKGKIVKVNDGTLEVKFKGSDKIIICYPSELKKRKLNKVVVINE